MMLAVIKPRINLSALFPYGFLRIHHNGRRIDLFLGYFTWVDKVPAHTATRGHQTLIVIVIIIIIIIIIIKPIRGNKQGTCVLVDVAIPGD